MIRASSRMRWTGLLVGSMVGLVGCVEAPPPPTNAVTATPPSAAVLPRLKRDALAALDGDWPALHMATLMALAEEGLVRPDEVLARRERNIGALLPYSGFIPAARMSYPLPALEEIVARFRALEAEKAKVPTAYDAECRFLLDALAPVQPKAAGSAPSTATDALDHALKRIDRLHEAGLISWEERRREADAIVAALELPPPPESIETPPPARATKAVKPRPRKALWDMHLLSMADPKFEAKAWRYFADRYDALTALPHRVERVSSTELGTTYLLLAGPLPEAEAKHLCSHLKARGDACALR